MKGTPPKLKILVTSAAVLANLFSAAGLATPRSTDVARPAVKAHLQESALAKSATDRPGAPAVGGAVAKAEESIRDFDYASALGILDRAALEWPQSPAVPAEIGSLYLKAEDLAKATAYFNKALTLDSSYPAAVLGLASVEAMNQQYDQADARINAELLKAGLADADKSRARALLALILIERGRNSEAEKEASRAVELDRNDSQALYLLAFLKSADRQADEARNLARQAIAADPHKVGALRLLSQYVNGKLGYERQPIARAAVFYGMGKALEREGKMEEARNQFENVIGIDPRFYPGLVSLASVCLRLGDYRRAAEAAAQAESVDPDGALAILNLALAYSGLQMQARRAIQAPDFRSRYFDRASPKLDRSLVGKIFPEYATLSGQERRVIDYSVEGLSEFLPKLVEGRATFRLVPTDSRITDYSGYDGGGIERTFDGRYYASIRGVGGRITLSGIENVEEAARCGYNAIAHEFAHQVMTVAMSEEQRARVKALYQRALKQGSTLDYYAAADEFEYFAVGYEAFASQFKRPSLGITGRHTREELKQRDPALFSFIVGMRSPQRQ